jgi:hypothetical protein
MKSTDKRQGPRDKAEQIQKALDEALAASFPASDPVSIVTSGTEEDWAEEPPATPAPPKQ